MRMEMKIEIFVDFGCLKKKDLEIQKNLKI